MMQQSLAWIHWDPPRFAFTIPFIDRPVAWYGIFFAFGFVLGILLIIPIIKRRISQKKEILSRDIANWPLLIAALKKGSGESNQCLSAIFNHLSQEGRNAIKEFKIKQEPNNTLKKEILHALSLSLVDVHLQLTRSQLENLFPKALYTSRELAVYLTDRMTWFVLAGTIIGARLGHVFFYDWPRYLAHPLDIVKIWEGGLASHGGTLGIMLALGLFLKTIRSRFPEFSFVDLLDILSIPTALAVVWIRIGNFFNQEILGPVTTVPWAIVFQHPYSGGPALPRHPAQLYEATSYLMTFFFLLVLWQKYGEKLKKGSLVGLFMVSIFGSRFFIEFLKSPQSLIINESFLNAGQYLSLPFIALGIGFLLLSKKNKKITESQ